MRDSMHLIGHLFAVFPSDFKYSVGPFKLNIPRINDIKGSTVISAVLPFSSLIPDSKERSRDRLT